MKHFSTDQITPPSFNRLLKADGAFSYQFAELSVEIEMGFFAGMFSGVAQITYWTDEGQLSWFVGDISLDSQHGNPGMLMLENDAHHPSLSHKLYLAIWEELTSGTFKDAVEARVMQEIEQ